MKPRLFPRRGFTLIEVMLSMAILALLAGAMFGTIQSTLSATSAIDQSQHTRQQIFGFFELCRKTFLTLNDGATILWNTQNVAGTTLAEVDLRQAPIAFLWGDQGCFYGETSICTHQAGDGTLTLGVEQREIDPQTGLTLTNPRWLPLVPFLKSVSWSFYDSTTTQWQDNWLDTTRHPALINITLQFN